jgi:hypothetical protein
MNSPFKFLDSFTLSDREVFFGRDQEIGHLYSMVFKSPLVMVYGLSGTGKTSLIQCGLASRFDGPDWFPFYIRREKNINESLHEALDFHLEDEEIRLHLVDKIALLYGEYFSPVYLIFDQLEELFILGSKKEQEIFIQSIRELLDAGLACRIILAMREEYLGYLYDFERVVPNIFDFRLRVERMDGVRINEVMRSSFEKFNISLEPPEEERLEEMTKNITGEKFGVQLPYLQVYLDHLYRQDYRRTYGEAPPDEDLPPLVFTKAEIDELGKIENVLEQFISEQVLDLQQRLADTYELVPETLVAKVLDAFVTEEGTKRPVHYTRNGEMVQPDEMFNNLLISTASPELLSDCINGLEKRRILRFTDYSIELAHDSIASLIDQNRTEQQRQLNQVLRRLKNSYIEYRDNEVFLTEKQLNVYEEYLSLLDLDENIQLFIEKSREEVILQKRKEEERKRAQLFKKLLPIIASLAILAMIAGIFAFFQWKDAVEARNELAKETVRSTLNQSISLKNQGNYEAAIDDLERAREGIKRHKLMQEFGDTLDLIEQLQENYALIQKKVIEGDILLQKYDLTDTLKLLALQKYEEALAVQSDSLINLKKKNLEQMIKQSADLWYNRAQIFAQFGDREGLASAKVALGYAMRLDPENEELIRSIQEAIRGR